MQVDSKTWEKIWFAKSVCGPIPNMNSSPSALHQQEAKNEPSLTILCLYIGSKLQIKSSCPKAPRNCSWNSSRSRSSLLWTTSCQVLKRHWSGKKAHSCHWSLKDLWMTFRRTLQDSWISTSPIASFFTNNFASLMCCILDNFLRLTTSHLMEKQKIF